MSIYLWYVTWQTRQQHQCWKSIPVYVNKDMIEILKQMSILRGAWDYIEEDKCQLTTGTISNVCFIKKYFWNWSFFHYEKIQRNSSPTYLAPKGQGRGIIIKGVRFLHHFLCWTLATSTTPSEQSFDLNEGQWDDKS